ncbi:H-NS family nucleoid-associated regulatory protein [Cupriavidus pauculus]|uniref:H-NS histone family protein n=1 Tax=Cupriavidus pauculus TaxID=82633 RepID=UPI001EE22F63|nr:H-NS histone family protein [Cupriavidus pauculus]GJG96776.1 H-NS histone family protein [Cupriavidus pauculus]
MATYKQLLTQKEALEAQIAQARSTEVANVVAHIHSLMSDYGLSVDDVMGKRRPGRPAGSGAAKAAKAARNPLPAKYRDPKTGKTWSGRGRAPGWLGKNPKRFLIEEA